MEAEKADMEEAMEEGGEVEKQSLLQKKK